MSFPQPHPCLDQRGVPRPLCCPRGGSRSLFPRPAPLTSAWWSSPTLGPAPPAGSGSRRPSAVSTPHPPRPTLPERLQLLQQGQSQEGSAPEAGDLVVAQEPGGPRRTEIGEGCLPCKWCPPEVVQGAAPPWAPGDHGEEPANSSGRI